MFEEGRRLMAASQYAEACMKFEASQRLDPGVGTLLNLGDCLERSGRTASAWSRFREAAAAAFSLGQRDRERVARQRADALAPKLCRLLVRPSSPSQTILRDGLMLDRALHGEAVPVDPGRHEVKATEPGKRGWSASVNVDSPACDGTTVTVDVVPLVDAEGSPAGTRWGWQRQVAVGMGGAAVVSAGIGTFLALDARSIYRTAQASCTSAGCADRGTSAGPLADAATVMFVAAGVSVVGAGVLWFAAPTRSVTLAPEVAPTSYGSVRGTVAGLVLTGRLP
jgi:hypothetical protein